MSNIKKLQVQIDALTEAIANCVAKDEIHEIEALLSQRQSLLSKLIPLAVNEKDKKNLLGYLDQLRERDRIIMQLLMEERDDIKSALQNVRKVKGYLVQ
jgi:hypothetical protein